VSDDPVVTVLAKVAGLMFPAVYAPDVQVGLQSLPNPVALGNPFEQRDTAYADAVEAIGQDPILASLIGDDTMYGTFITQDTGRGWALLKAQLPDVFVQTAASYVRAKQEPTDTVQPLLEELGRVVDRVRRLISGEPDQAVVLTALHGIELADDGTLETPWGTLRAASPFERSQRPFGNRAPSAILATTIPLRWKLGQRSKGDKLKISNEYTAVAANAHFFELTALLALGRDTPTRWVWQWTLSPLEFGRGFLGQAAEPSSMGESTPPPPLTQQQTADLTAWAGRVAARYDPSIAVAVRRTLSAVTERSFNAEDALIDAVIAWENLFGTGGTSEMVFRITTALAILLEPDPSARAEFRSDLGKVYSLRSKVTHGGEVKPKDHLNERKDQAIDVAIGAMRELFEKHPSLIGDRERGMRLILGATSEDSTTRAPNP
jgi:hypothetical protein